MFGIVPVVGFFIVLVPGIAHLLEKEREGSLLGLDDEEPESNELPSAR